MCDDPRRTAQKPLSDGDAAFVRRLLIAILVGALCVTLWLLSDLLLLAFASVLVAVVLRSLADPLARWLGLGERVALVLAALAICALFAVGAILFGYQIASQFQSLVRQLPEGVANVRDALQLSEWEAFFKNSESASAIGALVARAASWSTTLAGAVASLVIVVFGGAYFAADPKQYRDGLLKLVPPAYQANAAATIADAAIVLRRWVLAQAMAMVAVGVLVAVGLTLVGTPSALALGLIAGLAEFIPYVGPIVAVIPGLVVAVSHDWTTVWWTLGVYVVVQQAENNLLMPVIASRAAAVPPGLAIFMIVAMGILFGPLGVLLGFPLALLVNVAVKRLYVLDTLGEPVDIGGKPARASADTEAAKDVPSA